MFITTQADACGYCSNSIIWSDYPPILTWAIIGSFWFLLNSLIATIWKQHFPLIPQLWIAIILFVGSWIFGGGYPELYWAGFAGITVILPLLGVSFISWIFSFRRKFDERPRSFLIALRTLGGIAVLSIAFTIYQETIQPTPHGPLEMALHWDDSFGMRAAITKLKRQEPDSIEIYRQILKQAPDYSVYMASARLAEVGDPKVDMPNIIDALERLERLEASESTIYLINHTLKQKTGVKTKKELPATKWREVWSKMKDRQSSETFTQ